ncbi:MAG: T9SS type A sorting domain-containing protein [Ferruginibacter sp.]
MQNQQNPIEFREGSNLLLVNMAREEHGINLTIINQLGETVSRMHFYKGEQQFDLSSLPDGEYAVRLQFGDNVRVQKINIDHSLIK